jgi:hypothetical protein
MSKAKQILLDLNAELQGQLLCETYEINGRSYEMKLLTDSEAAWSYNIIDSKNTVTLTLTARVATLAVGIRSINGCSIEEIFQEDLDEILSKRTRYYDHFETLKQEEKDELSKFLSPYDGFEGKYLLCKLFYEWLGQQPSTFLNDLYTKWGELQKRQNDMQASVKKSLPESSEKSTEES